MVRLVSNTKFNKTRAYFKEVNKSEYISELEKYGEMGVNALRNATPVRTGETARSWGYKIVSTAKSIRLIWYNDNRVDGVPIAIILQYGHATRNGGYVKGIDYINPAIKPVFDLIEESITRKIYGKG